MYKLYIVRIFDPPLLVSSKFTYKIFVLTHTSKIEIRKKYSVISLLIKYGCAATLRPLALYVPFRPYTTKARSFMGVLVVVFDLY